MDYFPWNGSKRWLEPEIREVFSLLTPSGRYVEPFVGGGTVSRVARSVWPALDQVVGDANPWLTAYYERQVFGRRVEIPPNFTDVTYWRGLSDEDSTRLGVEDRALRFAICLLTAWGNRWEAYPDGRFRSTINRAYCDPEDLRKKLTSFFSRAWMRGTDKVTCADARAILAEVQAGDVVYLDPPYPETLGYGNNVWTIGDHLDHRGPPRPHRLGPSAQRCYGGGEQPIDSSSAMGAGGLRDPYRTRSSRDEDTEEARGDTMLAERRHSYTLPY